MQLRDVARCSSCGETVSRKILFDDAGNPIWECPNCGVVIEDHRWYKLIDKEEANDVVMHRGERGCFVFDTGYEIYGIDNTDGDAYVEEFPDMRECLEWLAEPQKGELA